jgi:hypothetical protein
MSAYLQMGHDSENLVGVGGLEGFAGLVLSPVNRSEGDLMEHVREFREKGQFDIILDPQLYCPQSERGQLLNHRYFPQDLDTADPTSENWWRELVKKLVAEAEELAVDAVCSPVVLPRKYGPDYYGICADTFSMLEDEVKKRRMRAAMTVCVALKDLAAPSDAFRIASIVSGRRPSLAYIVVEAEVEPRREIEDAANLLSLMVLVASLERAGCHTLVSHCSSDMVLMKAAGAAHCASGKYFNLRRFTRSRFDEQQDAGGGQLPYWFEESLMTFLREADIPRLRRSGFTEYICVGDSNSVFAAQILEQFVNAPGKAWLGLSWRQYLAWFMRAEQRLSTADAPNAVSVMLREAEKRWDTLDEKGVLLQERRNDGRWLRPWRQALGDFRRIEL